MPWLVALVAGLVVLGAVLAVAEAALSRTTVVRAEALRRDGRRNAVLLARMAAEPARYLNPVYLMVMLAQNVTVTLVAVLVAPRLDNVGLTMAAVAFTLAYFVVVGAMAKTFGVLHSDSAALALAPTVWVVSRILAIPARLLIGVANILLPGKGLAQGPFVSSLEIRSMADAGAEEGGIGGEEKDLIHSVFQLGNALIRHIMLPRADMVAVPSNATLHVAVETALHHGVSRLPVYTGDLDHVDGMLHMRDALKALNEGRDDGLQTLLRPMHFLADSQRAVAVLRLMQREKFHLAVVVDEYGSTCGLVTLEDLLEQLVGAIGDEDEPDEHDIEPLGDGRFRIEASVGIRELNDVLGTDLPHDTWNTAGGLMFNVLGRIPAQGQSVVVGGYRFVAEQVQGRRVTVILIELITAVALDAPDLAR